MELLINAGIDLDNQNDNGVTVLMYAASSGKTDAVKLLLEKGANPHLRNLDDFRAIEFASTVEILKLLRGVVGAQGETLSLGGFPDLRKVLNPKGLRP